MKLYEIEAELVAMTESLLDTLERGEEPAPEALALLDKYALEAVEKRDRVGDFLEALAERATSRKADGERAYAEARHIENARERIADYVLRVMQAGGVTMAFGERWKFVETKGRERVEVEDGAVLGEEFIRVKREANKEAIRKALDAGRYVAGAKMVRGERTLAVRRLAATDRPGELRTSAGTEVAR